MSQASLVVADLLSYTGLSASVAYDVPVRVDGSSAGSVGSVAMSARASSPLDFRVSNSFSWDVSDLKDHMSLALSSDVKIPEVVTINVTDSIGYGSSSSSSSSSSTYNVSSTERPTSSPTRRPTSSPTTLRPSPIPTARPTYSPTSTAAQPSAQPTSQPTSKPTARTQKPTYSAGVPTPSPTNRRVTVVSISQVRVSNLFLTRHECLLIMDSMCTA